MRNGWYLLRLGYHRLFTKQRVFQIYGLDYEPGTVVIYSGGEALALTKRWYVMRNIYVSENN